MAAPNKPVWGDLSGFTLLLSTPAATLAMAKPAVSELRMFSFFRMKTPRLPIASTAL